MKKVAIFLLFAFLGFGANAQTEEELVLKSIHQLFDAMRASDAEKLSEVLHPELQMRTAMINAEGKVVLNTENSPEKFINTIKSTPANTLDERLTSEKVQIDGPMAQVWTGYEFYVKEKFSHCGVNSFHLIKQDGKWLIVQLIDTRRKEGCP